MYRYIQRESERERWRDTGRESTYAHFRLIQYSYVCIASFRQLQEAFAEPETAKKFSEFKAEYEEENAMPLDDTFTISKAEAKKAKKRLKGQLKLDTGVDIKLSSAFLDQAEHFMEKGFDEDKHMSFVKIYYHRETGS